MKKLLFILFLVFGCTAELQTYDYKPNETVIIDAEDLAMVNLINQYRASKGLNALIPERILIDTCAYPHASYMEAEGLPNAPNHDGFYIRAIKSHATHFGEVVAYGFITAESFLASYESSPSHNSILVNPDYTHIGISHKGRFQCINLASYGQNKKSEFEQPETLINGSNKTTSTVTVTNVAGTLNPLIYMQNNGDNDGANPSFVFPSCVTVLADGTIVLATDYKPTLRTVATNGFTSYLSGCELWRSPSYIYAFQNGSPRNAKFNNIKGLANDGENVLVADTYNFRIRIVDKSGWAKTIAGSGISGYLDGTATTAQFKLPNCLCLSNGFIYVGDKGRIRKIDSNGNVTTIAIGFINIGGITIDEVNNIIYITDTGNNSVKAINLNTGIITAVNIPGLQTPSGTVFYQGNLFVADRYANVIYKNGIVWATGLGQPEQLAVTPQGDIIVANRNGQNILKISE